MTPTRCLLGLLALCASGCEVFFPLDGYASEPAAGGDAAVDAALAAGGDAAARTYRDEVLSDAPLVYLRFGEKSGSVAHDETKLRDGSYATGVVLGAPGAIAGDSDTAVTFDGTVDSNVAMPPGLDFPGNAPFSVEVWALQTARHGYGWAVDHQDYPQPRNGWGLLFAVDQVGIERWTDDAQAGPNASSNVPLTLGKYQHVVATFDGDQLFLYVDAAVVAQSKGARAIHPMTNAWHAGRQNCPCASDNFVGSLDELAIYDKALDAKRVLAHFKAAGR